MSGATGAIVAGSVITAGASVASSRQASRTAARGASNATGENARQFDLIRRDTAAQRALGAGATGLLGRLYGISTADPTSRLGPQAFKSGEVQTMLKEGKSIDDILKLGVLTGNLTGSKVRHLMNAYGLSADDIHRLQNGVFSDDANGQAPATGTPDMSAFFESPDYRFNLAEGEKALDRSLLARGRGLSGAAVKEGTRYASGMASNEFGNFFNRLTTLAGLGSAANNTSAQAGLTTAGNNANIFANAANQRASAYTQGAQGVNNSIQGGLSNWLLLQQMNKPPLMNTGAG